MRKTNKQTEILEMKLSVIYKHKINKHTYIYNTYMYIQREGQKL